MTTQQLKNRKTALNLLAIVVGMALLSYASVPLYRIFCQVTGYGGTTMKAEDLNEKIYAREINMRFNAITFEGLPWKFETQQNQLKLKVGEHKLAFFTATNTSDKPTAGTATYNVTPHKVGQYFAKIECFCFEEQRLKGSETLEMPVLFFIDPDFEKDPKMQDVDSITLSYTFFSSTSEKYEM